MSTEVTVVLLNQSFVLPGILEGYFLPFSKVRKISKIIADNPLAKLTSEKSKEEVLIFFHKILKSYSHKKIFLKKKIILRKMSIVKMLYLFLHFHYVL